MIWSTNSCMFFTISLQKVEPSFCPFKASMRSSCTVSLLSLRDLLRDISLSERPTSPVPEMMFSTTSWTVLIFSWLLYNEERSNVDGDDNMLVGSEASRRFFPSEIIWVDAWYIREAFWLRDFFRSLKQEVWGWQWGENIQALRPTSKQSITIAEYAGELTLLLFPQNFFCFFFVPSMLQAQSNPWLQQGNTLWLLFLKKNILFFKHLSGRVSRELLV